MNLFLVYLLQYMMPGAIEHKKCQKFNIYIDLIKWYVS